MQIPNDISIMDVMPTILYLLGLPIPEDVDGKPLFSAIREEFIKRNPVKYTPEQYEKRVTEEGTGQMTSGEIESIRGKLRGLDYIE